MSKPLSPTTINLIKARELITPEEKWTINTRELIRANGTIAHCALGALDKIINDNDSEVILLSKCIPQEETNKNPDWMMHEAFFPSRVVARFNDRSSHKEVLAWFDKTIQKSIRIDQTVAA